MNHSAPDFDGNVDPEGFVINLRSLYDHLVTLTDSRKARGSRCSLVNVLVYLVLAKLAWKDRSFGVSEWAKERKDYLAEALYLKEIQASDQSTYGRVLVQSSGQRI